MASGSKSIHALTNWGKAVAYHPDLARFFGDINAAILFCQMAYWDDKAENSLGTYKQSEDIEIETGLSYKEQLTARKKLVALGVLKETHKRLQHLIYYKVIWSVFNETHSVWREADLIKQAAKTKDRLAKRGLSPNSEQVDAEQPEEYSPECRIGMSVDKTENTLKNTSLDNKSIFDIDDREERHSPTNVEPEPFELFWQAYPKKENKVAAKKRFVAKVKTAEIFREVMDALAKKKGMKSTEKKFIPLASTWLSEERWKEEYTPSSCASSGGKVVLRQSGFSEIDYGKTGDDF